MKPNRLCLRAVDFTPVGDEARGEEVADGRTLEGYAAVFDEPTEINSWEGHFKETISKGAFRKTIRERKPVLQFDHGHDARTGSVPIGKIDELREDEQGLFVNARLFDNPVVEPIRQAIEGGAISGMSFRFKVIRDEWRDANDKRVREDELGGLLWNPGDRGPLNRNIKEVELFEAGPVVFPAYAATSVGVRSLSDGEREELVRDYARSLNANDAVEEEIREAAETFQQECDAIDAERREAGVAALREAGMDGEGRVIDAAVEAVREAPLTTESFSGSEDDAAQDEGTSSADERETPDDAAQDEGTSSGHARTTEYTTSERTSVPMNEPMTVEERVARQSEIKARLAEIDQEYAGATLPDETRNEWEGLRREFGEHDDAINDATARQAQLAELAGDERHVERGSDRGRPARPVRRPDNIYDLGEIRNQARSLDELAGLYRDNAMRAVEQGKFPGVSDRSKAQERVERLLSVVDDDKGTLARRVLTTGSPLYERAFWKSVRAQGTGGLTSEEQRAMSLGVAAEGGYAVPFQLDPTVILTSDGRINPLRQVARQVQITGKEWQGITTAGVTVSRVAENAEATDDSPDLAQPTVKAERVQGFIPFSMEIDQDWSQLQAEMTTLLQDAKEEEEAQSFFLGTAVPPAANGLITTLAASSHVLTAAVNSFQDDDVYALADALPPRFRQGASFMSAQAVQFAIRQFDTQGGAQMWERIGADTPAELLGKPIREASVMSGDTTTTGSKFLLYGDFKHFLIVDRVGMSVELVPHLFGPDRRYPTGERGLYAAWRNNCKVLVDNAFRLLKVDGV